MAIDLSQLLPEPKTIDLGRGKAPIYGLNIAQLSHLLVHHSDTIQKFITDKEPDIEGLITLLPDLSAKLIAMGLRAEGQEQQIANIPLATQIEILLTIWELSVPDAKKLMARLSSLSEGLKSLAVKENPKSSPTLLPEASSS